MRRSTAAAVGTLAGAAMIIGVRLSVTAGPPPAAVAVDAPAEPTTAAPAEPGASGPARGTGGGEASPTPSRKASRTAAPAGNAPAGNSSGLKDGTFRGAAATNPYGSVQVSVTVSGGRITNATATYP